jgi:hypothetical protein
MMGKKGFLPRFQGACDVEELPEIDLERPSSFKGLNTHTLA